MQDEVNEKTIALYIKTGKLTAPASCLIFSMLVIFRLLSMFEVEVILLIKYDTWSYLSMCHENKMGAAKNSTHIE